MRYLPFGISIYEPNIHLNRASALRQRYNVKGALTQGNVETAKELMIGAEDLSRSSDPEIQRYFSERSRHYTLPMWRKLDGLRLGKAIQVETYFKACTMAVRQRTTFDPNHLTPNADPAQGDECVVWIQCGVCAHPDSRRVDPAPLYEVATGCYIRRRLACRICPDVTGRSGRWTGSRDKCKTEPLDPKIAALSTTLEAIYQKHKEAQKLAKNED